MEVLRNKFCFLYNKKSFLNLLVEVEVAELLVFRLLVILEEVLHQILPVFCLNRVQENLPHAIPGREGKEETLRDQEVQKKPRKPRKIKEKS